MNPKGSISLMKRAALQQLLQSQDHTARESREAADKKAEEMGSGDRGGKLPGV